MVRPSRIQLVAATIALVFLLRPMAAGACSCTFDHTLMEEFDLTSAVFGGTVTNIQTAANGYDLLVTLTPTVRWKGGFDDPVQVTTGANSGVCGVSFMVGESYLVFAYGSQSPFVTFSCTRTGPLVGNPLVSQLPPPVLPVPTRATTWGAVKSSYR